MTLALRQRPLARVVAGIVRANDGALFDPSDLSTLYQDAAGTIPVTAVEQPVGKMLDKSGNGYHATQPITVSRPTLSARYNLLTYSEDFTNAAWSKVLQGVGSAPVVTSGYGVSPIGTAADRVKFSLNGGITNNDRSMLFNVISTATGASYEQSVWLKTNDGSAKIVLLSFNGSGNKTVTVTGQWTRFSNIYVSTDTSRYFRLSLQGNSGTSDSADLLVWGAQQQLGEAVGPYQRVNTTTDYDTDERYFKKYLRFDGVDDYLNLPYMGLYANGSASVVAGLQLNGAGLTYYIAAEGNSLDNDVRYGICRTNGASQIGAHLRNDDSSWIFDSNNAQSTVGVASVSSVIDSGSKITARNNVIKVESVYSRVGTLTPNNTTIGALLAPSAVGISAINLYGLIITKSALTDAQRIKCERYAASKSGVQL